MVPKLNYSFFFSANLCSILEMTGEEMPNNLATSADEGFPEPLVSLGGAKNLPTISHSQFTTLIPYLFNFVTFYATLHDRGVTPRDHF